MQHWSERGAVVRDGGAERRADAVRNREAILKAGLEVLSGRPDAGLGEIARASGLTRTTVYAHFATREELLEELLRRAVADTAQMIDAGDPGSGPADLALLRVLAVSWQHVAELAGLTDLIGRALGERAVELHAPVQERLSALVRRGRSDGTFRRDVSERWLLTTYFALVHAAGREVSLGASSLDEAEHFLGHVLLDAFAPAPWGRAATARRP
jgi:TetR/AcrR family transcriptional regulator, mexCD-oprJ operon repressor